MKEKETKAVMILAIESSCDETAVAILRDAAGDGKKVEVLCSEISSQIEIHREYGGVVPELASRNHSLALLPLVRTALENAGVGIDEMDGFCATAGPGLASSLLIGHTAAKAMSVATGKPFISVNHMEGHLLSPFISRENGVEPNVALVVSGGHTMIIENEGFGEYELIGKTLDDAAGEAFDKVAKMLQLPYPGGPEIEKCALGGDDKAYAFPRSMMKKPHFDFSFSGLKTAVLYTLSELDTDEGKPREGDLPDLCASFQRAVIDVLVAKTMRAVRERGLSKLSLSGGVSCNKALRGAFEVACGEVGVELLICSPHLSTDNAAMIGYVGVQKFIRGEFSDLSCDVNPNMLLNAIKLRK
ncbi:MAG: tRNA (adenosine(37)-N6)-threonylcarbamoyltransferase complex transferase subunit TsaD [Akkermansiaceae bacterium]